MKGKIFNAQEVQAIISGNKTQFREVIKPQPIQPEGFSDAYFDCYNKGNQWNWWTKDNKQLLGQIVKCPYQVGQKIFVKEVWDFISDKKDGMGDCCYYKANQLKWNEEVVKSEENFMKKYGHNWKPAQHMKQEHSRLTLQIKEIRVERLQDISDEDARKEGVLDGGCGNCGESEFVCKCLNKQPLPREDFFFNWNSTHKKLEEQSWANPWVWCVSFEIINN